MKPAPPARLLVVDDDEGIGRLIAKTLERYGHQVARATAGAGALAWLQDHPADLLLLDLKLGDINARDLVAQLHERGLSVPHIIITGQGDERVAAEMMRHGALDYLVKDTDFLAFLPEVVRRALDLLEKERRLHAAEEALRREFAFTSAVLDTCGALIVVLDRDGRIIRFNRAAEKVSGRRFEEVHSRSYFDLFLWPEDRESVREVFRRLLEGEPFVEHSHALRTASNERRLITWSSTRLVTESPSVGHIITTGIDVTESRRLEKEVLQVSERERRQIGQDLHDGLGQMLTGIEFMSAVLAQRLAQARSRELRDAARQAAEVNGHVREAIAQTRSLARGLSPILLESEGLVAALKQLAAHSEQVFGIKCPFEADPDVGVPDHGIAIHLYRIAQEAISNAIRHGKARRIEVHLKSSAHRITLLVKDHGVGLPQKSSPASSPPSAPRGLGLRIMQYRAGIIGGSLAIQRDPDGGTSVVCSVHTSPNSTPPAPASPPASP